MKSSFEAKITENKSYDEPIKKIIENVIDKLSDGISNL